MYVTPDRFEMSICVWPPSLSVTCCVLHVAALVRGSLMAFLLNVIDRGKVHVPLANVIVAVELLTTMPLKPNVLSTAIFDGTV